MAHVSLRGETFAQGLAHVALRRETFAQGLAHVARRGETFGQGLANVSLPWETFALRWATFALCWDDLEPATRAARGTGGKRQKAKITGAVPAAPATTPTTTKPA